MAVAFKQAAPRPFSPHLLLFRSSVSYDFLRLFRFSLQVGQRRCAWRIVCAAEQEEQVEHLVRISIYNILIKAKGNHMTTASARGYRKKIEAELTNLCQTILALLTDKLIPGATTAEAKVSYYKAQGDYYRQKVDLSDFYII